MLQRQKDIRRLQGGGCIDRGTSEDQGAAETEGHKKTAGGGGGLHRQRDVRGPGCCRDRRT